MPQLTRIFCFLSFLGVAKAFAPVFFQRRFENAISPGSTTRSSNHRLHGAVASALENLPGPDDVTEESIRSLFYLWNNALATGESRLVAKRYAKDAVLLPASSDQARMDYDAIKDYYDEFLKKRPQKEIIEGRIRVGYGWAEDAGICEISFGEQGHARVRARYSFVYVWEDHRWKILHHHSSVMPEDQQFMQLTQSASSSSSSSPQESSVSTSSSKKSPSVPRMTVARVKNLFQLYNDALDTHDANAVARLFSKSAVVYPPDGAKALKSPVEILHWLKHFVRSRPKIRPIESYVTIGPDHTTAKDIGTYELTLRTDQFKTICRYSMDYALDASDGQWKISHYQSTPVPDSFLPREATPQDRGMAQRMYSASQAAANTMSEKDVRALFQKWNEALQTRNSQEVIKRYSQKAVMVPTVSETPQTTLRAIQDFYDVFLLNKPHAKAVQSFVNIHKYWCKDVGILEYTFGDPSMGQSRRTVQERYSFLYVWEDDEWKIAHHHSSVLPEGFQPSAERIAGKEPSGPVGGDRSGGGDRRPDQSPSWM